MTGTLQKRRRNISFLLDTIPHIHSEIQTSWSTGESVLHLSVQLGFACALRSKRFVIDDRSGSVFVVFVCDDVLVFCVEGHSASCLRSCSPGALSLGPCC